MRAQFFCFSDECLAPKLLRKIRGVKTLQQLYTYPNLTTVSNYEP